MRRSITSSIIVLSVVFVWCTSSFAAIVWVNNADITEIAVIGGDVRITVQSASNTIQKYVDSSQKNEILATALTAYSMTCKVNVRLDTSSNKITAIVMLP